MASVQTAKDSKGFSLVELIVTILILGILAVAVIPQITNWIEKTKVAKDEAYAGQVAIAAEAVGLEHLVKGDLDGNVAVYTLTTTVVKTSGGGSQNLSAEIIAMIGSDKCKAPTQKGKSKYTITITPGGKTVTAKVEAE